MTLAVIPLKRGEDLSQQTRFMLPSDQLRAALLRDHTFRNPDVFYSVVNYHLHPLLSALEQAEAEQAAEYHVGRHRSLSSSAAALVTDTLWRLFENGVGEVFCDVCEVIYPCARLCVTVSWEPHSMDGYANEIRLCACPNGHEVCRWEYPCPHVMRPTPPDSSRPPG